MTSGDPASAPLTILFVCTGNICRSALAHHYVGQALQDTDPQTYHVVSAGTGWFDGLHVPTELLEAVPAVAARLGTHDPHYLRLADIRGADLILTATQEHRRLVLAEAPFALKRTFTILEFAQMLEGQDLRPGPDPVAWRLAIAEAARHRGAYVAADIPDPYRRGPQAYAAMRELMIPALDVIIRAAGSALGDGTVESTSQSPTHGASPSPQTFD